MQLHTVTCPPPNFSLSVVYLAWLLSPTRPIQNVNILHSSPSHVWCFFFLATSIYSNCFLVNDCFCCYAHIQFFFSQSFFLSWILFNFVVFQFSMHLKTLPVVANIIWMVWTMFLEISRRWVISCWVIFPLQNHNLLFLGQRKKKKKNSLTNTCQSTLHLY